MEDDGDLAAAVKAAAAGDVAAWTGLVDRFAGQLWAIARGFRLSSADAADVCQVAWLRLAEHLDRIEQPERVGAWLRTVTRNEALRVASRSGRTSPMADVPEDADPDPRGLPDLAGLGDGDAAALWSAFERIPERCQVLLRLLVLSDPAPSYAEVADLLDAPIGSLGPTRQRCLQRLRREALASGITRGGGGS